MKRLIGLVLAVIVGCVFFLGATSHVNAAQYDPYNGLCDQAGVNNSDTKPAVCNAPPTNPVSGSDSLLMKAISIISIVAGVVAVIMIMFSGLQMILSTGDSAKFTKARQTIIFAVVGIVVILLARTIISFILERV